MEIIVKTNWVGSAEIVQKFGIGTQTIPFIKWGRGRPTKAMKEQRRILGATKKMIPYYGSCFPGIR